jgi:hypothetical protein
VRRVADCSSGILLREGEREIGQVAVGSAWKFRGEDNTIPVHGFYLSTYATSNTVVRVPPPTSKGRKAKAIPSCPCLDNLLLPPYIYI